MTVAFILLGVTPVVAFRFHHFSLWFDGERRKHTATLNVEFWRTTPGTRSLSFCTNISLRQVRWCVA